MDPSWLDRYIEAWLVHPQAGGEGGAAALQALLGFMSDDVRYKDIPTGAVFVGHDGIRQMGSGALAMSHDMSFDISRHVAGQGSYAFETVCKGTNTGAIGPLPSTGASFSFRGISIGEVAEAGPSRRNATTGIWRGSSDSWAHRSDNVACGGSRWFRRSTRRRP